MDYSKLKALAEKATPGPWINTKSGIHSAAPQFKEYGGNICSMSNENENDLEYVKAANPETILQLINRLERLEKAYATARELIDNKETD